MRKHFRHKPVVLLLALCCLTALVGGTYAAYTYPTSGQVKRVVSAQTGAVATAQQFSSNYLKENGSSAFTLISVTKGDAEAVSVAITVCNYPQTDVSSFYPSDITYTISCTVKDANGNAITNSGITLEGGSTVTLPGGTMSHKLHTLRIPSSQLSALGSGSYIEITATPNNGLPTLSTKLKIAQTAAQKTGWEGSITGSDVDALNYQINGSKRGTVTITWNKDIVSLSKWSAEMLGQPNATSPLTISVGGENSPTSYLLQFYWADGTKTAEEANITCSFTAAS